MINTQQKTYVSDDFIMQPTVDFCFKELMSNPKVRQGLISALLNVAPESIVSTTLLPTFLEKEYPDDKIGILDVRVLLSDDTQIDFEMQVAPFDFWTHRILFYLSGMYVSQIKQGEGYEQLRKCIHVSLLDFVHFSGDDVCFRKISFCDEHTGQKYSDLLEIFILELPKLPPEDRSESGILRWMRFFHGKTRKEMESMAQKDPYIDEAYSMLQKMSADDRKRMEYEARQKAIRDHNIMIYSAQRQGMERGKLQGEALGLLRSIVSLFQKDFSPAQVSDLLDLDPAYVQQVFSLASASSDPMRELSKFYDILNE